MTPQGGMGYETIGSEIRASVSEARTWPDIHVVPAPNPRLLLLT